MIPQHRLFLFEVLTLVLEKQIRIEPSLLRCRLILYYLSYQGSYNRNSKYIGVTNITKFFKNVFWYMSLGTEFWHFVTFRYLH